MAYPKAGTLHERDVLAGEVQPAAVPQPLLSFRQQLFASLHVGGQELHRTTMQASVG